MIIYICRFADSQHATPNSSQSLREDNTLTDTLTDKPKATAGAAVGAGDGNRLNSRGIGSGSTTMTTVTGGMAAANAVTEEVGIVISR